MNVQGPAGAGPPCSGGKSVPAEKTGVQCPRRRMSILRGQARSGGSRHWGGQVLAPGNSRVKPTMGWHVRVALQPLSHCLPWNIVTCHRCARKTVIPAELYLIPPVIRAPSS